MKRAVLSLVLAASIFVPVRMAMAEPVHLTAAARTPHFLLRFDPDVRPQAEIIGESCEDWLAVITRKLGPVDLPTSLIPVFVYRNQGQFKQATGHDRPGEILGMASSSGYVELDASGIFAPPDQIAGHELTHIVIFRILGPKSNALPLWANEGMAKYMSRDFDTTDRTLLTDAVLNGAFLPLSSLSQTFPQGQGESLAYAEGTSAINFLVSKHGDAVLGKLLHAAAQTGSFDAAMRQVTGESAKQFEDTWTSGLERQYGSPRLFRIASFVGSLLLVLIAVGAYLGVRRRRRRVMDKYLLDEWEEANWRDWGGGQ